MATNKTWSGGANYLAILPDVTGFGTTTLFVFDRTESTEVTGHPLKESCTISITSKIRNAELQEFFDTYLRKVNLEDNTQTYEDSTESSVSGLAATVPRFTFLHLSNPVGNNVQVIAGTGVLTGDTGNFSTSANALADAPIEITAVPASGDRAASASDLYDIISAYVATIDSLEFSAGDYGVVKWFSEAD